MILSAKKRLHRKERNHSLTVRLLILILFLVYFFLTEITISYSAIQQMDHDEAHAKYAQYYALYVTNGVKAADKGDRLLNICRMLSNQMCK